ncbi:MAG: D-glycero-beta-D-manno-heptose 1-phosphate adenylyltransferase [Candidatus Omnitrophota bacterium]|nr:MAG: D-glycero-beta-D-manno-heptose 1-phosphate adenylyltransferase [Candidatus Omnitrophota bacterium]
MSKIKSLPALKKIVTRLKKQKKRIVFTNGCFDFIHPGHIKILRQAKSKGDILIVGLNSDSSVKKIKGPRRPIMNEKARAEVLAALEPIDYIVLFKEPTPYKLIQELKPHTLIKGADWSKDKIIGADLIQKVYSIKLYPGYSTTKIIEKIKKHG